MVIKHETIMDIIISINSYSVFVGNGDGFFGIYRKLSCAVLAGNAFGE